MTEDEELDFGNTEQVNDCALYISGPITSNTVCPTIGHIVGANAAKEVDRIVLLIQSSGGSLSEGFALAACIKASRIPVITVAIGECDSSALLIAMSGHVRYVAETCSILSHQYSAGVGMSKYTDLVARQKDLLMTANRVVDHYVDCTGLSSKEVRKRLVNDKDVFLSAAEAIDLGLFDAFFVSFDQLFPVEVEVADDEVLLIEDEELLNEVV